MFMLLHLYNGYRGFSQNPEDDSVKIIQDNHKKIKRLPTGSLFRKTNTLVCF
jgi:hypothetical protein